MLRVAINVDNTLCLLVHKMILMLFDDKVEPTCNVIKLYSFNI